MTAPSPPPARVYYRPHPAALFVFAIVIICVGILLATARTWITLAWPDAWALVAWIVIVGTLAAAWAAWEG